MCVPLVVEGMVLPYPDVPAALPVPDMMALVLSQLQPILEGFNRSLEHLNRQVGALSRDVRELKISQQRMELPEEEEAETELDVVSKQIGDVQRQIKDVEDRLRSQNAELHLNISSFKADLDQKLKDQQKILQVPESDVQSPHQKTLGLNHLDYLIPGQPEGHERITGRSTTGPGSER